MARKGAKRTATTKEDKRGLEQGRLASFGRMPANRTPQLLGVAVFAQATGSYGPNPWGDAARHIREMFERHHSSDDVEVEPGEPFSSLRPAYCNYVSFKPEIPKGMRAVIEVEGNEQVTDPKYGAIEIFVTPGWTPGGAAGWKPPGEARTTFGGNGGCWVRGPGRLTVHLATDIRPAPKITVRLEPMP